MNHYYKTVFNHSLGIWQVVSELAKSHGKGRRKAGMQAAICAAGIALVLMTGQAQAQHVIDGGTTETVPGDHSSPWNVGGNLIVGDFGTGTLTIEDGGTVSNSLGYIGSQAGSTGAVNVTGNGSTWTNSGTLFVGNLGTGTLTIENGGVVSNTNAYVGYAAGSTGTVTVTGNGSTWTNLGPLFVGDLGTGTLTIENGGIVSNTNGVVGYDAVGTGTVTVTGNGSAWINSGELDVGRFGTGMLTIENGGTVSNTTGYVGRQAGSNGTVTVTGSGSTWNNSGQLNVGYEGTGMLTIENGGTVSNTIGSIGTLDGSTGTVTVTGSGSAWDNSGLLLVGYVGTGVGTLTIENGGTVSNTHGFVAYDTDSTGTVNVTGSGSSWNNSRLSVGDSGTGTLDIVNGGTVNNTNEGYVGVGAGSTGTVTVTGNGSAWNNSSDLYVGHDGTGTLTIVNGGTVRAAHVVIGESGTGNGTLSLNGTAGGRGLLETGYVRKGTGTAAFNVDGGILRATGNEPHFLQNFTANSVTINAGGAFFDTQAFDVGIATANVLTGSGGLTKLGTGKLTVAGANSYTGNTTVSAGTLQFDTYTQNASQVLGIGASGNTDYGKLNVTGTATFASDAKIDVNVAGVNTLAMGQTLTGVISAGTLNASTFSVTDNSALFNFQANLNGTALDLAIVSASATGSGVYDAVMASHTYSAGGAARVLDGMIAGAPGGDMGTVITALGSLASEQEVSRAAAQTLPLLSGGVARSTLGMLSSFNGMVQNRFGNPAAGTSGFSTAQTSASSGQSAWDNRQVWLKPFGSHADQDDRDGAVGYAAQSWGFGLGAEGELDAGNRFGVAYAYADSRIKGNTDLSGTRQRADVDSHVLGVYGSRSLQNQLQLDWQADVGRNSIEGTRHIHFGGLDRTARADYTSYSLHAGAGLSKALAVNETTDFTPGVRVDYTWLRDPGYRESGADALNLDVKSNKTQALVLTAEGRLHHALSERSWLDANVGIGYDAINDRSHIVSTYAGAPGQSFTTSGIDHSPWTAKGGIGYTVQAKHGTRVSLHYDIEGRGGYVNQSASLRANWAF